MTAYFAWVVNRLGNTVPQLYYNVAPKKGQHGSDPVKILACYQLNEKDYEACQAKDKSGFD